MYSNSKGGSTIYNNGVDKKQYQGQLAQTQKQCEKQEQVEIQYFIYQDLQNLINIIYQRKAVLEFFKNNPTHEMITQSNNKLILQLNLSKAIHFDQYQQYKEQPQLFKFLREERSKAYTILNEMIDNKDQFLKGNQSNEVVIPTYLKKYKEQYKTQDFKMNDQIPLQETNQVAKFDEGILQKIISSIQNTDNQIDQIRRNKSYKVPDQKEILQNANNYYNWTSQQLKQNFSMLNPQDSQNTKQDNSQYKQSRIQNIGQEMDQKIPQSVYDEKQNHNSQQGKGIFEKEKLIGFINFLRQQNPIPSNKYPSHNKTHFPETPLNNKQQHDNDQIQWAVKFEKQYLLQQLKDLHNYFNLFTEYQKQIKGPETGQIDEKVVKTLINNDMKQKKDGQTYILDLDGFMNYCKDQIEPSSSSNQNYPTTDHQNSGKKTGHLQNQQVNQEYDKDQIYKFYEWFCAYYKIK
ncbi:unnamed protein product [Paramecium octaurelia]|uniref:Uncharacterized protein n=1 Tax=Paramecium octaurelia TaxID=43137 RepID=A0A8S1W306_PAROT|nr:unnamed protein product [Paramecium octaurelia]